MIFRDTELSGAFLVEIEPHIDERGFFARSFCQKAFSDQGLHVHFPQTNISFNKIKGTLRGMHYQLHPHAEVKLVRCTAGKIFDVIIDLRRGSPTFLKWIGVELSADTHSTLYIPEGFAHGFQTLENNTEVFYQMGNFYNPDASRGIRWNDPLFAISWPTEPSVISERDRSYKDIDISSING